MKNRLGGLLALVVSMLILPGSPVRADILDGWHWRNPTPFSDTMRSVCFGAGTFVAVGDGGVVHASADGTAWDGGQRPVVFDLKKVIYANGEFVAVGNAGSLITSTNGTDWVVQNSGTTNDIFDVGYGNGRFLVLPLVGKTVISDDGTNWMTTGSSAPIGWVTFGNGVFVGASLSGTYVSSDGLTWTKSSVPYQGNTQPHLMIEGTYGNGMFLAIVGGETNSQPASFFYSSVDGTNWVQKSLVPFGPNAAQLVSTYRFLGFLNGAFHEVDNWTSSYGFVSISITTDGNSCVTTYAPTNAPNVHSMAYGNGQYVLIEDTGKTWVSTDETNWVATYGGSRTNCYQLVQGNGKLVVAGAMLVSSDGVTFNNSATPPTDPMAAAAFDGTNFVAVGGGLGNLASGAVSTSVNGSDWVDRTSNSDRRLLAVCRGPSGWVAVGLSGRVVTSPDTLTWTLRSAGTPNSLNGLTYGNGVYVAVGNLGTVITSSDGVTWHVQVSGTTKHLLAIVFQNGQFTAVGNSGTIISSPDGVTWTAQNSGTTLTLQAIAYGNGSYLVGGTNNVPSFPNVPQTPEVFLTSTNGTNWSDVSTKIPTAINVRSIAYINQSFWIVGDNGMLLQSDVADGIPHFAGAVMAGNGGLKFKVTLNPAASYRVQFNTNLFTGTWRDVYTNTSGTSSTTWTDTNSYNLPSGFYRIVSP